MIQHNIIMRIQYDNMTVLCYRNVEYERCFPWDNDAVFRWKRKHEMLGVPAGDRQG